MKSAMSQPCYPSPLALGGQTTKVQPSGCLLASISLFPAIDNKSVDSHTVINYIPIRLTYCNKLYFVKTAIYLFNHCNTANQHSEHNCFRIKNWLLRLPPCREKSEIGYPPPDILNVQNFAQPDFR